MRPHTQGPLSKFLRSTRWLCRIDCGGALFYRNCNEIRICSANWFYLRPTDWTARAQCEDVWIALGGACHATLVYGEDIGIEWCRKPIHFAVDEL